MPYATDAFTRTIERVLCGQGYGGDVTIRNGAFALLAGVDVVVISVGIGTDAGDLVFFFEVSVGDACGNYKYVAFVDLHFLTFFSAVYFGRNSWLISCRI